MQLTADLLCYSEKGQLHIDSCLRTGLHEWYTVFLKWKNIRRASGVCVVYNMTTWSHHTVPSPASLRPPSSRPSLRPCLTVEQQWEEKTSHHSEGEGSQMHHAISYSGAPSCPLIWQPCRRLLSHSSFRLMRRHLQQRSSTPTD